MWTLRSFVLQIYSEAIPNRWKTNVFSRIVCQSASIAEINLVVILFASRLSLHVYLISLEQRGRAYSGVLLKWNKMDAFSILYVARQRRHIPAILTWREINIGIPDLMCIFCVIAGEFKVSHSFGFT